MRTYTHQNLNARLIQPPGPISRGGWGIQNEYIILNLFQSKLSVIFAASGTDRGRKMNSSFKFAHISDLHLTSLDDVKVSDLLNKRALGYLSWRLRRRREHGAEVLSALLCDLHQLYLDHIVITGDLTH